MTKEKRPKNCQEYLIPICITLYNPVYYLFTICKSVWTTNAKVPVPSWVNPTVENETVMWNGSAKRKHGETNPAAQAKQSY